MLRAETNVSRVAELVCFLLGGGGPQRLFHKQKLTFPETLVLWAETNVFRKRFIHIYIYMYIYRYTGIYVY